MSKDPRGFFSPETIAWKIHSDPAMAIGGIRALLQQALHPDAMDGVAKNSNFREDAWGRLQRTGDYVSTITFGSRDEADALSARVQKIHTALGLDDPHLLLWVHMSMVDSFLDIAIRSGLSLDAQQQDQYVAEMVAFAEAVGISAEQVPATVEQMQKYFLDISPELSASNDAKRAALFIALPPLPPLLRFGTPIAPLWGGITSLAAAALPSWARSLYGWPTLPGHIGATDLALKSTRSALRLLPQSFRETPQMKEARIRHSAAS